MRLPSLAWLLAPLLAAGCLDFDVLSAGSPPSNDLGRVLHEDLFAADDDLAVTMPLDLSLRRDDLSARQDDLIHTTGTSVTMPPGVLRSGQRYYLVLTATHQPGIDLDAAPNRKGFPRGVGDAISAIVTVR